MQVLVDLLPVIAFVVAYYLSGYDFNVALQVIMAVMTLQVAITWLVKRSVNRMLLMSWALVVVLGGISLVLKNELIFKWKPTILNWAFAVIFLGSQFIGNKTIIQRLLQSVSSDEIRLSQRDWRSLNLMWVAFFLVSGAANIYVAYTFDERTWVNFKLFGLIGMTFVFVLIQAAWMARRDNKAAADPAAGE
ncbi:MAG: septation protein IspZ [Gammaproteobacteria bacterium]|nr:septation protein IspZ [Gammaproteobacteria bacterium]